MKSKIICLSLLLCVINSVKAESIRELQFENDHVKVWKTTIPPNDNLKMHRHDHPRVLVGLKGGKLLKIEESGEESNLIFETNKAYWLPKDPEGQLHGDINISDTAMEVMVIEFKGM